ncbi:BRO family protein [Lactobacillus johnsonii]|uniref:BRO family protein n=1 Tax=Lactobacillus johnsonii TaxID=33959 RepID=UPI001FB28950|nr:ORF6C domain-containing protein [Lactobacillus johnsonii]UOC05509.1 ORF6C domain-containing protein [Lactobacillus johnsonii]
MKDKIQSFEFEGKEVRTLKINDEPWFVGKDLATILGYSNTRDALNKHVDSEDKNTVAIRDGITRGNPNQTIVNESGMFSLILSSNLPNAKKFKRWVTSEVLPTIRKTGSYQLPQTPEGQIRLLLESSVHTDERLTNVEEDIDLLKNKSEIDSNQRFQLQKARNKRAIEVCGGKESNFYKTKSRKVFMELAHDLKEFFEIPRYDALRKEDFNKAIEFINGWYPSVLLKREIDEVNAQTDLDI